MFPKISSAPGRTCSGAFSGDFMTMDDSRLKSLQEELAALGASKEQIEEALVQFNRGENFRQRKDFYDAAEAYHFAIDIVNAPTFQLAFCQCMIAMNQGADAIMSAKKALELAEQIDHAPLYVASCDQMARALLQQKEFDKAAVFAQEAKDVCAATKNSAGEAHSLNLLGTCLAKVGKFDKALELFHHALELFRDDLSKGGVADAYGNIGTAHYFKGAPEEAKKWHEKALKIHEQLNDKESRGKDHYNLGIASERMGDLENARGHYRKALEIFVDLDMKSHIKEVQSLIEELDEEPNAPTN